jgi:hypothetical protein
MYNLYIYILLLFIIFFITFNKIYKIYDFFDQDDEYDEEDDEYDDDDDEDDEVVFVPSDLYTGDVGDKGDRGEYGDRGDIGLTGGIGGSGLDGYKGEQGDYGISGKRGNKGPVGRKGQKGRRGFYGPVGDKGVIGPKGIIGPKGGPGYYGVSGDVGDSGIIGEKGSTGPRGLQGYKPALVQDYNKCYWLPTNNVEYKFVPGHHISQVAYKNINLGKNRHECMEFCTRDIKCKAVTMYINKKKNTGICRLHKSHSYQKNEADENADEDWHIYDTYLKVRTSNGQKTNITDSYTQYQKNFTLECKNGFFINELFFENNCGGVKKCWKSYDDNTGNNFDTRMRVRCCPITINDIPQKDFLWKRLFGAGGNGKKVLYYKMFLEMNPDNEVLTIEDLDVSFKQGWYVGGLEASKSDKLTLGHIFDRDDYEFIMVPVGYVTKTKLYSYLYSKRYLFDNLYKFVDTIFTNFCHDKHKMFVFNFMDFINNTLIEVFSFGNKETKSIRYMPKTDSVSKKYLWHNTYQKEATYSLKERVSDPVKFNDDIEKRRTILVDGGEIMTGQLFPGLAKLREMRKKIVEIKKKMDEGTFEIDSLENF